MKPGYQRIDYKKLSTLQKKYQQYCPEEIKPEIKKAERKLSSLENKV